MIHKETSNLQMQVKITQLIWQFEMIMQGEYTLVSISATKAQGLSRKII